MRAAELLESYGFRGIFFVIPSRIHDPDTERWLNPADLRRLSDGGHRVAAHGYHHRSLPASGEELAASLLASLPMLEAAGSRPSALDFAFPFGHYAPFVAAAIGDSFAYLHTVNPGYWDGDSPMLPRLLIAGDVDLDFYTEYLLGGRSYSPSLEVLATDGAVADTVRFRLPRGTDPTAIELLAVSADADGRFYASHPIDDAAALARDTLVLDLRAHVERHYSPERAAISLRARPPVRRPLRISHARSAPLDRGPRPRVAVGAFVLKSFPAPLGGPSRPNENHPRGLTRSSCSTILGAWSSGGT